ncbi:MAG TPA: hypothetical protein VNZ49_16870 [Bacteroidia bacterium]|jgi:hypothetical protein|nr:hypothetical protein [Bacteroidia bacterium]
MKKIISIFSILLLNLFTAKAQVFMGMYGTRSSSFNTVSPDKGNGLGISLFSEADTLGSKKSASSLSLQFGMNFFYSNLGNKYFYHVPLISPALTEARVNLVNYMYGSNITIRLNLGNKKGFNPYVDLFGGYSAIVSRLVITPNYDDPYMSHTKTYQALTSVRALDYGIGGGVLISMGKNVKFDVGVLYTAYMANGPIADISSAYEDGGNINLNMKSVPEGIASAHIGFVFYIDETKFTTTNTSDTPDYNQPPVQSTTYPLVVGGSGGWNPPRTGGTYHPGNSGGGGSYGGSFGGSRGGAQVGVHIGGGGHTGHTK